MAGEEEEHEDCTEHPKYPLVRRSGVQRRQGPRPSMLDVWLLQTHPRRATVDSYFKLMVPNLQHFSGLMRIRARVAAQMFEQNRYALPRAFDHKRLLVLQEVIEKVLFCFAVARTEPFEALF
ncbi:hypothetical protein [Bradyrhizobium zhanjiangense]|uniref:hypothetical protein n=1 Tax=Bradyrhizobium zhanjiangense TaxID=1325107 RepID=UPI001009BC01|nr:hypothetical protein [Bradyrhizobium zhanjiangense]